MLDQPKAESVWQSPKLKTLELHEPLSEAETPVTSQVKKSPLWEKIHAVVAAVSMVLSDTGVSDGGSFEKKENDPVGKMSAVDKQQIETIGQQARKEHDVMKKDQHGRYEGNIHLHAKNEPTEAEWRMLLTTVPPGSYRLYFGGRDNGGLVMFYIPEDGKRLIFLRGYYPQSAPLPAGERRPLVYKSIEKEQAVDEKKGTVLSADQKQAQEQERRVYGELIQEAGDMHVFEAMGLKKGAGVSGLSMSEVISKDMLERALLRLATLSPGFQGRGYHIEIPMEGRKFKALEYRVDLDGKVWFLGERAVWLNRPSGVPLNYQPGNQRMLELRRTIIRSNLK